MKSLVIGSLVFLAVAANMCFAAPKPAIVQGHSEWTVDVRFEHLQQIEIRVEGEKQLRRFWYTIITVTNDTGRDVDFYPKCDLMTDTFEIIRAFTDIPGGVFEHIMMRHQSRYPLLESLEDIGNKILQGEDNARDITIVWRDFDNKAKNVSLFITGLSNETIDIDHPIAKDEKQRAVRVYLRKTLMLEYSLGGDWVFRSDAQMRFTKKSWVMR